MSELVQGQVNELALGMTWLHGIQTCALSAKSGGPGIPTLYTIHKTCSTIACQCIATTDRSAQLLL